MAAAPILPVAQDFLLDKVMRRLRLIEDYSGTVESELPLPTAVDAFLSAVVEAYELVSEMTSADKQQVSVRLASVRELCVKCNREMKGGSFSDEEWKCRAKVVADTLRSTVNDVRRSQVLRQLQLCEHNLSRVENCKHVEIILNEFRRLLHNSTRLLEFIYKQLGLGTLKGQQTRNTLLLCASQIQKCFPLLLYVLENSNQALELSLEGKQYVVDRMKVCFKKIRGILDGSASDTIDEEIEDDLGGGMFIAHMDEALSLLAVFDAAANDYQPGQWQDAVEKVLQHAFLIAQVASQFDFKMIHGSGEKILRERENLKKECGLEKPNQALRKLHASSLSSALEELEQRVCAAVLRMYLQVFSEPFGPLRDLVLHCWAEPSPGEERTSQNLTELVDNLDSHSDRLSQVALFAIACSGDENRILAIRSCLASLESLEPQLVPSLSSLYLQQTKSQQKFVHILGKHWNSEVQELHKLIDGIIDSAALAQVTHSVVWVPTATLKKVVSKQQELSLSELNALVKSAVSQAAVLLGQLKLTMEDLQLSHTSLLGCGVQDLFKAVKEGNAVLEMIQQPEVPISMERILKRCELLVSCVQRLQPLLEDLSEPLGHFTPLPTADLSVLIPRKEATSDVRPHPMKSCDEALKKIASLGLPLNADIEFDVVDSVDEDQMKSFVNVTASHPRFTTSILYKERFTPRQSRILRTPGVTPRPRLITRKHHNNTPQQFLQQTLCLDITNILEGLTGLSQTLRSQNVPRGSDISPSVLPISSTHKKMSFRVVQDNELDDECSRPYLSPSCLTSCSSFSSRDISTPERLNDLAQVQERINAVKVSSQETDLTNSPPMM